MKKAPEFEIYFPGALRNYILYSIIFFVYGRCY